jgi:acyl-CoA thioester hydrolase
LAWRAIAAKREESSDIENSYFAYQAKRFPKLCHGGQIFRKTTGAMAMAQYRETMRLLVQQWDCDHVGHLNVRSYMGWMADATIALAASLGYGRASKAQDNLGLAAIGAELAFKSEIHAGESVIMMSALEELSGRKLRMAHRLVRLDDDVVGLQGRLTVVCFDEARRRGGEFPQAFRQRLIAAMGQPTPDENLIFPC